MLRAGSSLFVPPRGPVRLNDPLQWWTICFGADWRHPTGPDSSIDTLLDPPVVPIPYVDAPAYAGRAGKELPTSADWAYAERGCLDRADSAWVSVLAPGGVMLAYYWQDRKSVGWGKR